MKSAGLIGMGGYLPGKEFPAQRIDALVDFLRAETLLAPEYIEEIKTGRHLPGRMETNEEGWVNQPWYEGWLDHLPGKKRENPFQGCVQRRRVPMDPESLRKSVIPHPMLSSDAETLAGALAIFNTGIDKSTIDLVLGDSLVPDRPVPLNASLVQHKLGLTNAGAYNVDTCCSSFVTMLEIAMTYVRAGIKNTVLIVASAIDTHINDRSTYYSPATGDAAVAGIVTAVKEGDGYLASHSTSNGNRHAAIVFARRRPELFVSTSPGSSHEQEFVTFNDMALCKETADDTEQDMHDVAHKALSKAGLDVADIDLLVTHQPVAWAPHAWQKAIGVPPERFYQSFEKYANIACASAPVNLIEAVEQGMVDAGGNIMMASPGVGQNLITLIHRAPEELISSNRL